MISLGRRQTKGNKKGLAVEVVLYGHVKKYQKVLGAQQSTRQYCPGTMVFRVLVAQKRLRNKDTWCFLKWVVPPTNLLVQVTIRFGLSFLVAASTGISELIFESP